MSKLKHCGRFLPTRRYRLNARSPRFCYEILLVAHCPRHTDVLIMGWYGINWKGRQTPVRRIPQHDAAGWLARIETDRIQPQAHTRDLTSSYSLLISQPVDRIYQYVLKRLVKSVLAPASNTKSLRRVHRNAPQ
jgi:hypothetical protein